MPKAVHDAVNKMLANKEFYPDKSATERRSIAWAIATKDYKKKNKQSFLLPINISSKLIDNFEFGAGFQIIHLTLQNRTKIYGVKVYNCCEGVLPENISIDDFDDLDIINVEVVKKC